MVQEGQPLISVIIPTYNRPHLLPRALNSIISQPYDKFEIVVINDNGTDVRHIIDEGNRRCGGKIKYINSDKNHGASWSRNLGLENCSGDYIMFLDDDDIILKYSLTFRMFMMKALGAEVVYTRALQDIWKTEKSGYISVHKQLYWDCHFSKDQLLVQNIAPNCCVLFSRKAWDKSGNYKFDTNLETGEDYDFWIAISRNSDFEELGLIDVECSLREDKTQATGVKDFTISYPIIYKRWRDTAIDREQVVRNQNAVLLQIGKNPEDYGL